MLRPTRSRWLAKTERFWDAVLGRPDRRPHRPLRDPLVRLEDRVVPDGRPAPLPMLFAGSAPGSAPQVKAYDGDTGTLAFAVSPYEATFTGGVNVAALDLNADGFPDVVAGPGAGGGSRVVAYDGKTGDPLAGPLGSFWAFESSFTGGVSVAAGDVTGDGVPDVVVGAGAGGGPRVRVFDGATGDCVADFWAFEPSFTGGVNVAAADLTLDGRAEVVVGAGAGGGPVVRAFDLASGTPAIARGFFTNFLADDPAARGGASVAVGDVNGDLIPDVIAGPAAGPGAVKVFNGFDGSVMSAFADSDATAGVRVAAFYLSDDRYADVVVAGAAGPGRVQVYNAGTGQLLAGPAADLVPFGAAAGVSVAAANDPGTAGSVLSVTTSSTSVASGQAFAITAQVVEKSAGGSFEEDPPPPPPPTTPTGAVTFYLQQTAPAAGNTVAIGQASLAGVSGMADRAKATVALSGFALEPGTYDVWGAYGGDAHYAANGAVLRASVTVPAPARRSATRPPARPRRPRRRRRPRPRRRRSPSSSPPPPTGPRAGRTGRTPFGCPRRWAPPSPSPTPRAARHPAATSTSRRPAAPPSPPAR